MYFCSISKHKSQFASYWEHSTCKFDKNVPYFLLPINFCSVNTFVFHLKKMVLAQKLMKFNVLFLPPLPLPQMLPITEPIPIGDWLSSYKLGDYTHLFEASGYDRTDFLLSITSDELVEIGVQKPGHKKKIMSAVSSLIHKEHLIATKPVSTSPSSLSKPLCDVPINDRRPFFF